MKNVVLCCDGTANEFAADRTNVVKLFSVLVQEPARQAARRSIDPEDGEGKGCAAEPLVPITRGLVGQPRGDHRRGEGRVE